MIQIEEITIENFRGVRNLTLPLNRRNFAIQGPNATGKSCVVDAIEFALTGSLSRLGGEGTGDLSIASHASHVDLREKPETARVTVRLHLTNSNCTFTLTRSVKKPNSPKLKPDTQAAREALACFSKRAEITLTRRQIVKYILAQATKRGEHVQELLRLDGINKLRKVLASAERSCKSIVTSAKTELENARQQLKSHLGVASLADDAMLAIINERRVTLGLPGLESVNGQPLLDSKSQQREDDGVVRATAIRDLHAFREASKSKDRAAAAQQILTLLARLDSEPALNRLLRTQELVQLGLELVDEDACPLCDSPRPLSELRSHLEQKLRQSEKAAEVANALSSTINELRSSCEMVIGAARPVWKVADALHIDDVVKQIKHWGEQLQKQISLLENVESVRAMRDELLNLGCVDALESRLVELEEAIKRLPDQSATIEANQFLAVANTRLKELRDRELALGQAEQALAHAQFVYRTYCRVSTDELESLYRTVEHSFAESYCSLHSEDEAGFSAKLRPEEGKLGLDVDFHGRGMFPPGAYHSEGHQDSMGLCLYLALMKQVFGDDLRLVVLDDVVMSVDSGHRRELCRMLTERFPDTQFVITTHEEAWFHQIQSTGLIDPKYARMFQSWTPEDGPLVSDAVHAWDQIDEHLSRNDVPASSHALRRHLEYVLPQIADRLRAKVTFSISGRHDAGGLLDGCYTALRKLLETAEKAAQAWQDVEATTTASTLRKKLKECMGDVNREGRYVNATIHFNDWATLVRQDFEPVVRVYRELLDCFRCEHCGVWLKLSGSEILKCDCGQIQCNLSEPNHEQRAKLPAL